MRPRPAGRRWLAVATAGEAAELREAGIGGPVLVMGALDRAASWRSRSPPRPTSSRGPRSSSSAPSRRAAAAGADAREARQRDGPPRHARGRRGPRMSPKDRGCGATRGADRGDDPLRHRRRATWSSRRSSSSASWQFAARVRERHPAIIAHAANSAATLRLPDARLDMVRCGVAIYGLDPVGTDPATWGLEPALELTSYLAAVKPIAPGESSGLRPAVHRHRADGDRDRADRLRRRGPAGPRPGRPGPRRRRAPTAGRNREHGQHHDRSRARTPRRAWATR